VRSAMEICEIARKELRVSFCLPGSSSVEVQAEGDVRREGVEGAE
jgi:hypothetical protein